MPRMAPPQTRRKRRRGSIETLRSGALRVRVYAGIDPVTKARHYLRETVPPGRGAKAKAEKTLTRLLNQVDERRHPRTNATVGQLMDRWLEVVELADTTRRGYENNIRKHIRPLLGSVSVAKLDPEVLDSFYAELRRCREHCDRRRYIERHRAKGTHDCAAAGCKSHMCRSLAPSTIRQIHWILSGALSRAVRWRWIAVNPADQAEPPGMPTPNPQPPSAVDAARLVTQAWHDGPEWGVFVWMAMTTGARRGEICALRWRHIDLEHAIVTIEASVVQLGSKWSEKRTKTHQMRRVTLSDEDLDVIREHRVRCQGEAAALGVELSPEAYVFTSALDPSVPYMPDTATQRFTRLARRLDIDAHLHSLRHYSATELIAAGVDVRTVAGRLGHAGGGATTLRVYAAWRSESDQRAAGMLAGRMPALPRPSEHEPELPKARRDKKVGRTKSTSPSPGSRKQAARRLWDAERAEGQVPTGGALARAAGVDSSLGRRWRREWMDALDAPTRSVVEPADQ